MRQIYLVARRDFLAYVGAWGFWVSLLTAPLLLAALLFGPLLLTRAEPPRAITVIADVQADAVLVRETFEREARERARGEIQAYLATTAPQVVGEALAVFDAAPDRRAGIIAARDVVQRRAPRVMGAFAPP